MDAMWSREKDRSTSAPWRIDAAFCGKFDLHIRIHAADPKSSPSKALLTKQGSLLVVPSWKHKPERHVKAKLMFGSMWGIDGIDIKKKDTILLLEHAVKHIIRLNAQIQSFPVKDCQLRHSGQIKENALTPFGP